MNSFFPCILVEHADHFSIICSDFHYFDSYFVNKDTNGYSIESLAKKLVKEHNLSSIQFDSEAGMFCAYSQNKDNLLKLTILLREITGNEDEYIVETNKPTISLYEAEKLLLKGFVFELDKQAQKDFYKSVPTPNLSKKQKEYIDTIENGTKEEKIFALKRINSEARTRVRNWDNYLSHPNTITQLLKAIDLENDDKVIEELIAVIAFIADRHLPDLRTKPYFEKALNSKYATTRRLGLIGLSRLYEHSEELILKLIDDRSEKVRKLAELTMKHGRGATKKFPIWMFSEKY